MRPFLLAGVLLAMSCSSASEPLLSVTASGPGTVNVAPASDPCPDCAAGQYRYKSGTTVTVTATPAAGATLAGWSGSCTGASACTVRLDGDRAVIATFSQELAQLGVQLSGDGSGSVASDPAGIDCGGLCLAAFPLGARVTLSAVPAAGSVFTGWSGACQGDGACDVALDQAHSVSALFSRAVLGLAVERTGPGSVLSSPAGIACGIACASSFPSGTQVTLAAFPDANAAFAGWGGACTGTGSCVVSVDQAATVAASFIRPQHTISVSTTGAGSGSVFSSPVGISCGASCAASFDQGATVVLAAAPDAGSMFLGWSGGCTGLNACVLLAGSDQSAVAHFGLAPPGSTQNPAPTLLSVTPNTATAGTTGLVLTLQGQNFVPASVAFWSGQVRGTTFVDSNTLKMTLLDSDLANPQAGYPYPSVQVGTPVPGGGLTSTLPFTITVPSPTLTGIDPPSVLLNSGPVVLTLTGTGFLPSSQVQFANYYASQVVTYVSPTTLLVSLPATAMQTAQTLTVTVSNGGYYPPGVSGSQTFTIQNPSPVASSVVPAMAQAGSGDVMVTVYGSSFVGATGYPYTNLSSLLWNGASLTTTFLSSGELRAAIPAAQLAGAGTGQLTVATPAPGGGTSGQLPFAVTAAPTQITACDPPSATAGAAAFTLSLQGHGFTADSAVTWNGSARAATYLGPSLLKIAIAAADVAAVGSASIAVSDPSSAASPAFGFAVLAASPAITSTKQVAVVANDLAWDATRRRFYASVPSTAAAYGNTIAVIDADAAAVVSTIRAGSEPGHLAMSDDASKLYVALGGASKVQRIDLAAQQVELEIALAQNATATDLRVLPGAPGSVAVATTSGYSGGGTPIFDDAVQRPETTASYSAVSVLALAGPDTIYGTSTYGGTISRLQILPTGVFTAASYSSSYSMNDIQFDGGRLFTSTGSVLDAWGARLGTFALPLTSFWVAPDVAHGRVFFLSGTTLQAYDPNTFVQQGALVLAAPAAAGRFVRWDRDGLAYRTSSQVVLLRSSLVGG